MKKPYSYDDRDPNQRCTDCGKPLKKNLLARKAHKPLDGATGVT